MNLVEMLLTTDFHDRYKRYFQLGSNGFSMYEGNLPGVDLTDEEVDEINWEFLSLSPSSNCSISLNHSGFIDGNELSAMQPFTSHKNMHLTTMTYEDTKFAAGKIVCKLDIAIIEVDGEMCWNIKPIVYEVTRDNFTLDFLNITDIENPTVFRIGFDERLTGFFFFVNDNSLSKVHNRLEAPGAVNDFFKKTIQAMTEARYGKSKIYRTVPAKPASPEGRFSEPEVAPED